MTWPLGPWAKAIKIPPMATGTASVDFINLRDFFANLSNGDSVKFPYGQTYSCYSGAIQLKPNQIIDFNWCTFQRPTALSVATSSTVGDTTLTINMADTSALLVGMSGMIMGPDSVTPFANIYAYGAQSSQKRLRIASIIPNVSITLETAITNSTYVVSGAAAGAKVMAAGAVFTTSGPMIDAQSLVLAGMVKMRNVYLDGNKANNAVFNHWETTAELLFSSTGGTFEHIEILNAPGEGIVASGFHYEMGHIRNTNSNGNFIHFNGNGGNYGARLHDFWCSGTNLDLNVGHANGSIITSDNCFGIHIQRGYIDKSKLFAFGSWDTSDDSYARIEDVEIRDCWCGAFEIYSPGTRGVPQGIEIYNVTVRNCGISYIGSVGSSTTFVERGRGLKMKNVIFYDSFCSFGCLSYFDVDVTFIHLDSNVLTGISSLSARADVSAVAHNFGGRVDLTSANGVSNYNAGPDSKSICMIMGGCDHGRFKIRTYDGTKTVPVTPALTYSVYSQYTASQGGPWVDVDFDISTDGGYNGTRLEGVFRHCRFDVQADGIFQNDGMYLFCHTNVAATMFPASSTNGLTGVTISGTPNASGYGMGSGGVTTRTAYALSFSGGTQTIAPTGWFIVENGALQDVVITRPGNYSSGTPTISLSAATGLTGATVTAVMGTTEPMTDSDDNYLNVRIHNPKLIGTAALLRVRQDTTSSAGCGTLTVSGRIKADAVTSGAIGISDTQHESVNMHLKDLVIEGPTSGWTQTQLTVLTGANIGTSKITRLLTPSALATPVGWGTQYMQRGSVVGTVFADQGFVGELLTATLATASATSLTTATAKNVTSLALTKGSWIVFRQVDFILGGTTGTEYQSGVSATTGTLPVQAGGSGIGTDPLSIIPLITTVVTDTYSQSGMPTSIVLAADTTIYLVAQATFTVGTVTACGTISALRVA